MTKGRKTIPAKLKIVKGTFRKDRANPNEPEPEVKIPSPPDFLNADALQEWGRMSEKLYQLGMISEIDRGLFANYCQSYGKWAEAERIRVEMAKKDKVFHGLMIRTKSGNVIQNPIIGIANKAAKDMRDAAALMGIPATMRGKVNPIQPKTGEQKGFARYQTR